jgi:hypothetical protein
VTRTCRQCGEPFIGHANAKVCGTRCRRAFNRAYLRQWKGDHRKAPKPTVVIAPFPADIDRREFGGWLSGFADGEATFGLRLCEQTDRAKPRPNATAGFRITLRDDDAEVLRLIQSFWGCGTLSFHPNSRSRIPNANPIAIYSVQRVADLMDVVVPHFERHPLRAKKRSDFEVWRRGVELLAEIQGRPLIGHLGKGGTLPRWTEADREKLISLSGELKAQRRYAAPLDFTPALYSCNATPKSK